MTKRKKRTFVKTKVYPLNIRLDEYLTGAIKQFAEYERKKHGRRRNNYSNAARTLMRIGLATQTNI